MNNYKDSHWYRWANVKATQLPPFKFNPMYMDYESGSAASGSSPTPAPQPIPINIPSRLPQNVPGGLPPRVPGGFQPGAPEGLPQRIPEEYTPQPQFPRRLPDLDNPDISYPEDAYEEDAYDEEETYPGDLGDLIPPRSPQKRSQRPQQPSTGAGTIQQPPSYQMDTFVHNGQRYQCQWVYCCQPVGPEVPGKIEPNASEDMLEFVIWKDENIPEYRVDKCDSSLGFCLNTRNSVFQVIARIIFPKGMEKQVINDIKQCLNIAAGVALTAIGTQIAGMEAVPPSIPALLPSLLETAYAAGKTAFFECIETKLSYDKLKGKVRYTVYYDQSHGGEWHAFNDKDALDLLKKFYLYSTGLILIPGVGSFEDLANKIGVDQKGLENFFKNPSNTVKDWGRKISEGFTSGAKKAEDFFNDIGKGFGF